MTVPLDKIVLQPGELMVLQCPPMTTREQAEKFAESIPPAWKDRVLVVSGEIEITVVSKEDRPDDG